VIHVGIPSIGLSGRLTALAASLACDPTISVAVYCNGDEGDLRATAARLPHGTSIPVRWLPGAGIYDVWNAILDDTDPDDSPPIAAVLNDDIHIDTRSIHWLGRELRVRANTAVIGWDVHGVTHGDAAGECVRLTGTYKDGGVPGFAFMMRADLGVRCDPRFGWWFGDDDLMRQVQHLGYEALVMKGVGVEHDQSTSSTARPQVLASIGADRLLFEQKWDTRT
jgi:hypothetical protein